MKKEMIILSVKTHSSLTAGCYDWGETHLIVDSKGETEAHRWSDSRRGLHTAVSGGGLNWNSDFLTPECVFFFKKFWTCHALFFFVVFWATWHVGS